MLLPHRMPRSRKIKLDKIKAKREEKQRECIENKFLNKFDLSIEEILHCKDEEIRIKEELENSGKITRGAHLWQKKLSASYKFFARMLGYIDGKTAEVKGDLNFEIHFLDKNGTSEAYEKLQEKYIELDTRRQSVVKDYIEQIPKNSLAIIDEAVKTNPSSDRFAEVFEDIINNSLYLPLQNEFVEAYNEGYLFSRKFGTEEKVYSKYDSSIDLIKSINKTNDRAYQYKK